MWHSEINNRTDVAMRFIQMWFLPSAPALLPSVEQMRVEISQRTNRLMPLVSSTHPKALPIRSQARVFSCFLEAGKSLSIALQANWGAYLCLLEGGPIEVNDRALSVCGAAMMQELEAIEIAAQEDAELLLKVML